MGGGLTGTAPSIISDGHELQLDDGFPRAKVRTRTPLKCANLGEWAVHPLTRKIAARDAMCDAITLADQHEFVDTFGA